MADVDKGLYAAPVGVEEMAESEEAIEIEIEDQKKLRLVLVMLRLLSILMLWKMKSLIKT